MVDGIRWLGRLNKLMWMFAHPFTLRAFIHGTAPAIEHLNIVRSLKFNSLVDVGANKGQFSLLCLTLNPHLHVLAFEPIPGQARIAEKVLKGDVRVVGVALGSHRDMLPIHISTQVDSSSLYLPTQKQINLFPNTATQDKLTVDVYALSNFEEIQSTPTPRFLKIDVQGFELEVLKGAAESLDLFEFIYVELSFSELYYGQPLAAEVINWLREKCFALKGIGALGMSADGLAVQADFLFIKSAASECSVSI